MACANDSDDTSSSGKGKGIPMYHAKKAYERVKVLDDTILISTVNAK